MTIALAAFVVLHGLIHVLGFVKAFKPSSVSALKNPISRRTGVLWLACAGMMCLAGGCLLLGIATWWIPALAGVILSQWLIIRSWSDAKYGTIANIVIFISAVLGLGSWLFRSDYHRDVRAAFSVDPRTSIQKATSTTTDASDSLLSAKDLETLPPLVRRYIEYTGALHAPKVRNFFICFQGKIRKNEQTDWMSFTSEQYNFMNRPTRLFFMNATMNYLPVAGYHHYNNGAAVMDIRLFSMFPVQQQSGREMNVAEMVTFFNDMCLMAPGSLVDNRITWGTSTDSTVKASFTHSGITIGALLVFNGAGELVNFVSDDRYATQDDGSMKRMKWSTPAGQYRQYGKLRLASHAETVYTYPQGDFTYGTFDLQDVQYNLVRLD